MADRETVLAEIETAPGPISVYEFSHFLYLFRAAYAGAVDLMSKLHRPFFGTEGPEFERFLEMLRASLPAYDSRQIVHLASKPVPEDLTLLEISRRNPLGLEFGGIPVALVAAVILSGGSLKLGPISVKLPPLGTGIAALRDAFGGKPKRRGRKVRARQ